MKKSNPPKPSTEVLFVRLPVEWARLIKQIAQEEVRPKSSVAKQAIRDFLEHRLSIKLS